jgi:hypothetical protein
MIVALTSSEGRSQREKRRVIPERYWRLSTLWSVFGAVATILPLANLYFMIFKPD